MTGRGVAFVQQLDSSVEKIVKYCGVSLSMGDLQSIGARLTGMRLMALLGDKTCRKTSDGVGFTPVKCARHGKTCDRNTKSAEEA